MRRQKGMLTMSQKNHNQRIKRSISKIRLSKKQKSPSAKAKGQEIVRSPDRTIFVTFI